MGCSNCIVKWFEIYLSERRQRVVIIGQSSDWVHILAGVPQESIIGPLLSAWFVTFNPLKTTSMLISRKRNPVLHPPLCMNGTMIEYTYFHKHLGLTISNTGSCVEHVNSILEKSWSRLNLLKSLKVRVSRKSLDSFFPSTIKAWNNLPNEAKGT